jgi:RNA polymerase sigma factor (sigma-70 family)
VCPTDSELIARVLAYQDQQAFGELVLRYQSPVRGFLARMTRGDTHLADDVAQETFVKVWRKLHTYRGGAQFSTWLFSIAYREFCKVARKVDWAGAEEVRAIEEESQMEGAPDAGARMDLQAAMLQLNTNERAAITLCCQNGMSHEEAAHVLECPLGTVKTNVLRGKEKLRRLLYDYARTA